MKQGIILITLLCFVSAAQETSFSWYNVFFEYGSDSYYFCDGTHFNGPFRVNGPVWIRSYTPGRDNDPYFRNLILSSDFYYYGSEKLPTSVPHPDSSNLWIEPYEQMEQGEPWFHLGAPEIPFGPDEIDWGIIRSAAIMYGLYLEPPQVIDDSRLILTDNLLLLKTENSASVDTFFLDSLLEPVVWIENGPYDRIYIKGAPFFAGLSNQLMIGTTGDIYAAGSLYYDEITPGMLGLMSVEGDLIIACDPDDAGGSDWDEPFDIQTDSSFQFSSSVITLSGHLKSENPAVPEPLAEFILYGGFQGEGEGWTSTSNSGFDIEYSYDPRLQNQSPPWYPQSDLLPVWETTEPEAPGLSLIPGSNPFSSSVTFTVQGCDEVCHIDIYNLSGRSIDTAEIQNSFIWSGERLPAGVYIIRIYSPAGEMAFISIIKL